MIENRLIKLFKNRNIFDQNICTYQNALDKSNFKHKLTYKEYFNKRNRTRKIIYFNPPFCESVKTNIIKIFFVLINKHFKQNNSINKLIHTNNCKLSYCMSNIKMLIQGHNIKKTLNNIENTDTEEPLCNCRNENYAR